MPGPTRFYKNNADRQRAYPKRKQAEMEEGSLLAEATAAHAWVLQEAVRAALREGDPTAQKIYREEPIDTLRALIDHFHDQAGTPAENRPWGKGTGTTAGESQGKLSGEAMAAGKSDARVRQYEQDANKQ